jgi:phosphopantothenate synthetase
MADMISVDELSKAMYKMVKDTMGMKKWKATDLQKASVEMFGDDKVDKALCKEAIKELVNSGQLVYTYFGGSFLEVPHKEGAAND